MHDAGFVTNEDFPLFARFESAFHSGKHRLERIIRNKWRWGLDKVTTGFRGGIRWRLRKTN